MKNGKWKLEHAMKTTEVIKESINASTQHSWDYTTCSIGSTKIMWLGDAIPHCVCLGVTSWDLQVRSLQHFFIPFYTRVQNSFRVATSHRLNLSHVAACHTQQTFKPLSLPTGRAFPYLTDIGLGLKTWNDQWEGCAGRSWVCFCDLA